MTRKENLIRTIERNDPAWVPYRYDGSLTMLDPVVTVRAMEGGVDDWGIQKALCINPIQWREGVGVASRRFEISVLQRRVERQRPCVEMDPDDLVMKHLPHRSIHSRPHEP